MGKPIETGANAPSFFRSAPLPVPLCFASMAEANRQLLRINTVDGSLEFASDLTLDEAKFLIRFILGRGNG